jgi:methionyl-tRNA formyltransferase
MRIVFIGTVEFSQRALARLIANKAEVAGVCTLKDAPFSADHVDLSTLCAAHAIPSFYADDINSPEALDWIRARSPDVIFCFGWSRLLKQELLELAPMGVVGFHPAALPANRGRHPLIWALVLGLEHTASTFFFMDAGADSGDILSQRAITIDPADDARDLYDKVTATALDQIEEFVPLLESGTFLRRVQDHALANTWRKRGMADGKIDWRMSAHTIHNLVRGLAKPYVGAHFVVNGKDVKVWKSAVIEDAPFNIEPGKVLGLRDGAPVVKCGDGALCLLLTEPPFDPNQDTYL